MALSYASLRMPFNSHAGAWPLELPDEGGEDGGPDGSPVRRSSRLNSGTEEIPGDGATGVFDGNQDNRQKGDAALIARLYQQFGQQPATQVFNKEEPNVRTWCMQVDCDYQTQL